MDLLSSYPHPRNSVTVRLMTKRYVNSLVRFQEREMVMTALWSFTGYDQIACPISKGLNSPSTYTLQRKLSSAINAVTSVSSKPLYLIFYTGLIMLTASILYVIYLLMLKLFGPVQITGWTSLMASTWLLGGVIISFLGLIGIYLAKIFTEVKQRPYHTIRAIYTNQDI